MKIKVSIYKKEVFIARKTVNGKKQAEQFEKETIPQMSMTEKVKQGWKVYKSY